MGHQMVTAVAVHLVALFRRYLPVLVVALLLVTIFFIRQQIAGMDGRFFQPSLNGTVALGYYLIGEYANAAKAYRAHFKEMAESGVSSGDLVRDAILRRDFSKARIEIGKLLVDHPDDIPLLITAGEIELEDNRPAEALQRLYPALRREPHNRDASLLAASAHARLGSFDAAINRLKTALSATSSGSWSRGFLLSLETTGLLKKYERQPMCLLAHYYRYLRIFDPSNARPAIRSAWKAIEANDRPDDAYLSISLVLGRQGDREAALAPALKAIEINPRNAEAYWQAAILYQERGGVLRNEFLMWKGAFEAEPYDIVYRDAFVKFLLGRFGDYHQALHIGRAGLETDPEYVPLRKKVAETYLLLGDYEKAIQEFQPLLSVQSEAAEAHILIGESYSRLGRYEEGISAYEAALTIEPANVLAHEGLAGIYLSQRRRREAIQELETAFRAGYDEIEPRATLCNLYLSESDYRKAEDCLKQVLMKDPENKMAQHMYPYVLKNSKR